ncbi:MAG: 23S rRNA methyltransferase [Gemmatimonadota bacterium]
MAVGDVVALRIRALASSGAGLAELPDGRVAFVQRAAPGDLVEARVRRLRPRWGQAELLRVLEPGPARVEAPCPHYQRCGGCTLQHLEYDEQRAWKARFVADAMARIGGTDVAAPEVVASPERLRYRNRVTFTVRRLSPKRVLAGFHALEDPARVVDVDHRCLLPEPAIGEAWGALRAALRAGAPALLPPARELRVTLRALEGGGVVALVRGGAPGWDPAPLAEGVPGVVGVWHWADGAATAVHVAGEAFLETWGEERVPVGGQAFLQVNRAAAAPLAAHVLAQAGAAGPAVDAYCGVGVYGRALARAGWTVTGIEVDADACAAARHGAPEGFRVVAGRVEERLADVLPAGLVILNPPRTGLHGDIPPQLLRHHPPRVVYVSCDPATLARDARRLADAYALASLRGFDLFPQTSHVETVAVFTLRGSGGRA